LPARAPGDSSDVSRLSRTAAGRPPEHDGLEPAIGRPPLSAVVGWRDTGRAHGRASGLSQLVEATVHALDDLVFGESLQSIRDVGAALVDLAGSISRRDAPLFHQIEQSGIGLG